MASKGKSLISYGMEVTQLNSSLDFRAALAGPILQATLRLGFYSITSLCIEVARAMQEVDPDNEYTVTADRSIAGFTQSRMSIATDGTYLDLLFTTGPRTGSTCAPLLGFNVADYTGGTLYNGSASIGITLISTLAPYNYNPPTFDHKIYGVRNISASGTKEAVTFGDNQLFLQIQFMYEPQLKCTLEWAPFMDWAARQRLFEITPDLSDPTIYYEVTLEKTASDGNGMAWMFKELLPRFPFLYDSGILMMRVNTQ